MKAFYIVSNPEMIASDTNPEHCWIKIGKIFKESPEARLRGLNRENINGTYFYHLIMIVSNPHEAEQGLKRLFKDKHYKRELYRLDNSDIEKAKEYCEKYFNGKVLIYTTFEKPSIKYNTKEIQNKYIQSKFPQGNIDNLNKISKPDIINNQTWFFLGRNTIAAYLENINGKLYIKEGSMFRYEPLPNYLNTYGKEEREFCLNIYKNKIKKIRGKAILKEDLEVRDIKLAARIVTGSKRYRRTWCEII